MYARFVPVKHAGVKREPAGCILAVYAQRFAVAIELQRVGECVHGVRILAFKGQFIQQRKHCKHGVLAVFRL